MAVGSFAVNAADAAIGVAASAGYGMTIA